MWYISLFSPSLLYSLSLKFILLLTLAVFCVALEFEEWVNVPSGETMDDEKGMSGKVTVDLASCLLSLPKVAAVKDTVEQQGRYLTEK